MTGRFRVELIRFGLLLTMTVALVSVALRADHHHSSSTAGRHTGSEPSVSPAPTSAPGSTDNGGESPSTGSGSGSGPAAGQAGASGGGSNTGGTSVAMLPRTGYGQAADLAGLAVALIAAGAWTVTVSRPSRR